MDATGTLSLGYVLVYFSDVLGQRDRMRALLRLPVTPEERESVLGVLRETVGFLALLRDG